MAPRTQRCGAHVLSDRHPHAGELQPLAHDLQRPQPPSVRRKTVDTPVGRRRHLQRLSALRLADDRHLDGERSFRLALQPAVRPLLPGRRAARQSARGQSVHLAGHRQPAPLQSHRSGYVGTHGRPGRRGQFRGAVRQDGGSRMAVGAPAERNDMGALHALPALDPSGADAAQLSGKTIRKHPLLARKGRMSLRGNHRQTAKGRHPHRSRRQKRLPHRQASGAHGVSRRHGPAGIQPAAPVQSHLHLHPEKRPRLQIHGFFAQQKRNAAPQENHGKI